MSITRGRLWRAAVGALIILLILLVASGLSAQTEAVELRFKLTRGEILHYSYNRSSSFQSFRVGTTPTPAREYQDTARRVYRVLDVDPNGVALVEVIDEDIKRTESTRTDEYVGSPLSHKIRPDGSVAETDGAIKYFPLPLPTQPIRMGESWTRRGGIGELEYLPGPSEGHAATFTLISVDRVQNERVARVRYRVEARFEGSSSSAEGIQMRNREFGHVVGELQWSIDRGRAIRIIADVTTEGELTTSLLGQPGSVTVKSVSKDNIILQMLRPEEVAPPAVAPEVLIVPAKGIGPFGLDLSVAELTARAGAPETREIDLNVRARSLKWPNGLVGYLDPNDEGRLVGLEIANKSFRTAKGIGPNSSRGAVFLGYGISAASADMMMLQGGSVRVLIYNEAGIAFSITTAWNRGLTSRGTVNWVTVFPPGMAGKIYSLP